MLSITRQSLGLAQSAVLNRGFAASAVSFKKKESLLPPAPKGAATSYGLFVKDRYTSDRSSYTSSPSSGEGAKSDISAASAKIAQEWNDLSSSLKEEYAQKAKELKKTYDAEYKAWYESLDKETIKAYEKATGKKVAAPGGKAGSKKARDELARQSGQPARPLTAFFEYLEHLRQGDGKGLGVVELAKKAGEEWKGMVEEEKKKFRDTAADKKAKYLEWQNSQTKQ